MKILIITHALEKGGAEKLIVDSIPYFRGNNIQVELLLFNASSSVPAFLNSVKNAGVPIHDLRIKYIYSPIVSLHIRRFLRKNRYDIVHVHLFPALYWVAWSFKGLKNKPKLIFTEHSNHNKRRGKKYFNIIERRFYNVYDTIIGITDNVTQNLYQWIGSREKIVTIENGVDIESIRQAPQYNKESLCTELNIRQPATLIMMTASFRYPKDQQTLIKAGEILGENFHILFAGEGELRQLTEQLVQDLSMKNRVHFLGFRNDTHSLMKSIDFNVLSTFYEGMSGVTLESMAAGRVFLGTDVAGVRELVPDGRFLFPAGDFVYLANQIRNLTSNQELYNELIELGIVSARQFDMIRMVDRYINLYSSLVEREL